LADALASLEADGNVGVRLLGERSRRQSLVGLGCDPAVTILSAGLAQERGVEVIATEAGSIQALEGLARGEAHLAGCHLIDEETGLFNLPWVRRLVPFPCTVIGFAVWEQGLVVAAGNPLDIGSVADLARPTVRIVNRAAGSGSRALLDAELRRQGIASETVDGYGHEVSGHLAVAEAVAGGFADTGVAVRAVAVAYGLDFVQLGEERYDLVIPNHFLDLPSVAVLLDYLGGREIRTQVEALGGYDSAVMGMPA
jgi:putative molybdopterin biosynthesis protein